MHTAAAFWRLYHSRIVKEVAGFRILLDNKLEILVEAHKWREVDKEKVFLLLPTLIVLGTNLSRSSEKA